MASKNRTDGKTTLAFTSKGVTAGTPYYYGYRRDRYYKFTTLPYAQVPVDDLRFADPVDIETFHEVENVLQVDKAEENLLYVHIYTPEVRPKTSDEHYTRPVIVVVPSFMQSLFGKVLGGEFFCAQDVVLVMLFFRQDILGFSGFAEPNEELGISGEAGLKDIIKGFEFVKEEIRHFGGCPDNITAYAQGASCIYIRHLTLPPYSGKYFHKMILSSSVEHTKKQILTLRQFDIRQVAEAIDPDGRFEDDRACLEFLRKVPFSDLLKCSDPMYGKKNDIIVRKNNLLAVEGDIYGVKMPVLIGFNSMEALLEHSVIRLGPRDRKEYLEFLLWLTQTKSTKEKAARNADKIIEVYKANVKAIGCRGDIYYPMIESDIKFLVGIIHLATNLAKEMYPENVYLYQYSADFSKDCIWNPLDDKYYPGTGHGHEMKVLFDSIYEPNLRKDAKASKVIMQMTGIWAQFAKTGNPNPRGLVETWLPIGDRLTHYFEIRMDDSIYREFSQFEKLRFKLWEKIYGIEFFSAPIRKREPKADAVQENDEKTDDKRSVIQTYTILPKTEPLGKVLAYTSKGSIESDVCCYCNIFYSSFQHVPYAQVPVGNLRFAAPKDIDSFDDVKSLKLDENGRYGLEDNLFLHIYTPEVRPEKSDEDYTRPVIVFVPGRLSAKAEQYRSEDLYGPEFLLEQDVVLVVLSYRRGILGFTAFEEPNAQLDVPIDAGIQDIMQAFRFVKNEIRHFGGCPDNVTAYGQGTGATHVRRIAAKHAEDNLFHKMILSSSMEHATGIELPMHCYEARSLAKSEKHHFTDDKDCIEFLRKIPIEKLLLRDAPMFDQATKCRVFREKHLQSLSTTESYATPMPVLLGYNSMEGLMEQILASSYGRDVSELDWTAAVDQLSDNNRHKSAIANTADVYYSGLKVEDTKNYRNMMYSDACYIVGTIALAYHFARTMAPENVYLYRFGVDLDCNFTKKLYGKIYHNETAHADELGYIFKTPVTQFVESDSYEDLAVKRMTKAWAQFARTGNPNPEKRSELFDVEWKPVVGKKLTSCFRIDTRHVDYNRIPEMYRLKYWESVTDLNFFSGPLRKAVDFEDNFADAITKKDYEIRFNNGKGRR